MKKGDILQSQCGQHIVQVFEVNYPSKGSIAYTDLEDHEVRFVEKGRFRDYRNLGDENSIFGATFYMFRSIHMRLNKLSKV